MADNENDTGYKKPPKAFQFQKGRSGNPSGRRRKAQGIPEMLGKVTKQRVRTNGKNGLQWMTKGRRLFRRPRASLESLPQRAFFPP